MEILHPDHIQRPQHIYFFTIIIIYPQLFQELNKSPSVDHYLLYRKKLEQTNKSTKQYLSIEPMFPSLLIVYPMAHMGVGMSLYQSQPSSRHKNQNT